MTTVDRDFLVFRRRPRIVDILTPKRVGVQGYRLKAARNFDLTFQTILTADICSGYLDPVALKAGIIDRHTLGAAPGTGHVRIVFDPNTFAGPHPANLDDDENIWLQWFPVDYAGVEGPGGPLGLILPDDEMKAQGRVIVQGTAPAGASVANSLRLDLPYRMRNFVIRNNEATGGNDLAIATVEGGSEIPIAPQDVTEFFEGGVGALLVRGVGGDVTFSATMTHYLPL